MTLRMQRLLNRLVDEIVSELVLDDLRRTFYQMMVRSEGKEPWSR